MTGTMKLEVIIDNFEDNHPDGLIIRMTTTYHFDEHRPQPETYLLTKLNNGKQLMK